MQGSPVLNVSATADRPGSSDIVFPEGTITAEMDKWKRFANTLKLRVLMRQSLIPSRLSKVTAGFASLAGQSFLAAGENA